ncbi:MAG: hypothetical protein U5L11_12760 [Arhodomonas sp.]|nr:hypothetical protein [Arhodomonas sp.]
MRLTWYVANKPEYLSRLEEWGEACRNIMGRNFPGHGHRAGRGADRGRGEGGAGGDGRRPDWLRM